MASIRQLFVSLSLKADTFNNDLKKAQNDMKEFEKTIKPTITAMKNLGEAATETGTALTVGLTVPLTAISALAVKTAIDFDEAMDTIRASTGATGDTLTQLGTDFRTVLGKVPSDIEDVTTAITALNQRTGQSGRPLQDLAEAELNLARITKSDVNETIRETTRLFANWHIAATDQVPALDTLLKVSQMTGVGISKLAAGVTDSGAVLRQFGMSFEQTAALIGQFEKAGVNADGVIRGLGLSLKTFAKAGITDSSEALAQIEARIKGAGDAATANKIAIDFFGKSGIQMAAAIREGRLDIVNFEQSLKNNHETIATATADTLSFADKLVILKNQAQLALEPIGKKMLDALEALIPTVTSILAKVASLAEAFASLSPSTQTVIFAIGAVAAAIGPLLIVFGSIVTAVTTLVPVFTGLGAILETASVAIGGFAVAMGGLAAPIAIAVAAIGALAGAVYLVYDNWNDIEPKLVAIWETIQTSASQIWGAITTAVSDVASSISKIWSDHAEQLSAIWDGIKTALSVQWDAISEVVKSGIRIVGTVISDGFSALAGIIDVALGVISGNWKLAWQGMKEIVSSVWSVIKGITTELFRLALTQLDAFLSGISTSLKSLAKDLPNVIGAPIRLVASGLDAATSSLSKWANEIDDAAVGQKALKKTTDDHSTAVKDLKTSYDSANVSAKTFSANAIGEVKTAEEMKKALEEQKKAHEALQKAQDAAYKSAYDASKKAMDQMTADGDSAIKYWTDIYKKSLDAKIKAFETIENIVKHNTGVLQQGIDQDSANYDKWLHYQSEQYVKSLDDQIKQKSDQIDQIQKMNDANLEYQRKQLETATNDVKNSAGKIFDDMFVSGQNVFTSLQNLLKGGALSLGRTIFEDISGALLGPIDKAFNDFFTSLIESTGIKSFVTSLGNKLGGLLSGVFGGGSSAAAGIASSASGAVSQAAGAASSAASSAASGVTSGVSSLTGSLISAAGSVVGGLISALGSARQEGTLNAIEYNTRAAALQIRDMMDGHLNWILNMTGIIADRIHDELMFPLVSIDNTLHHIADKLDAGITTSLGNLTASVGNLTQATTSAATSSAKAFADAVAKSLSPTVQAFQLLAVEGNAAPELNMGPFPVTPIQTVSPLASATGEIAPVVDMGPIQNLTLSLKQLDTTITSTDMGPMSNQEYFERQKVQAELDQKAYFEFLEKQALKSAVEEAQRQADMQAALLNWDPRNLFTNATGLPPLPTYAVGTKYVPSTGPALLHQGEQVIPANENRASNVTFAPVINNQIDLTVNGSSQDAIDSAIRQLRQMLKLNAQGITEDFARYIHKITPGIVNI